MIVSYSISIENPVLSSNRTRNKIYFLILSEFAKFLYHSNVFVLKSKNGGESLPTLNKYFVPYCSVVQSYPALCEHMDCSMPGFLVFHCFQEFAQTHWSKVPRVSDAIQPSHPLLPFFLPSIFPSIKVFPSELALCIRWPKYWSFCFSISPSSEHSGLISFRIH